MKYIPYAKVVDLKYLKDTNYKLNYNNQNYKNMYNEQFCEIYDNYGWDYFSLTMGAAILKYFYNIKTNVSFI